MASNQRNTFRQRVLARLAKLVVRWSNKHDKIISNFWSPRDYFITSSIPSYCRSSFRTQSTPRTSPWTSCKPGSIQNPTPRIPRPRRRHQITERKNGNQHICHTKNQWWNLEHYVCLIETAHLFFNLWKTNSRDSLLKNFLQQKWNLHKHTAPTLEL